MRSAVGHILAYNSAFSVRRLTTKFERMAGTPFGFFRATFFLFAADVQRGAFRRWPHAEARGAIIGDLHTENFGSFRATNGEIVYDINDFDETTEGFYEWDLNRLATSLVLAALDNKRPMSEGIAGVEAMVHSYLGTVGKWADFKKRSQIEVAPENGEVQALLHKAREKSRLDMLRGMVRQDEDLRWVLLETDKMPKASPRLREEVEEALPFYLSHCVPPEGADPSRYNLQDVAERVAGAGSLGRLRLALLLGKGKKKVETLDTLRLIEWKQSLDSALDAPLPRAGKRRGRTVTEMTCAFQVYPKRYLGYLELDGMPMQARELGANDLRFPHGEFANPKRLVEAACAFGIITARAHLLASKAGMGPRAIPRELAGHEGRWVHRIVSFAAAYTERVREDYDEFLREGERVRKAWSPKKQRTKKQA